MPGPGWGRGQGIGPYRRAEGAGPGGYSHCCHRRHQHGGLLPVDALPAGASPYGLLHLSGNVLEWVSHWYRQNLCDFCSPLREADLPLARLLAGGEGPPPAAGEAERQSPTRVDPRGPAEGAFRVLRGGAWSDGDPEALTASRRFWLGPEQRFPDTGFRCAR